MTFLGCIVFHNSYFYKLFFFFANDTLFICKAMKYFKTFPLAIAEFSLVYFAQQHLSAKERKSMKISWQQTRISHTHLYPTYTKC